MINDLEHDSLDAVSWFTENFTKVNKEKCHSIIFGENQQREVSIGDTVIKSSDNQKLISIIINKKVTFKRLHTLARLSRYMKTES